MTEHADLALQSFDPLLVELVTNDAPSKAMTAEGFTPFEISAVRTLVKRSGSSYNRPAGDTIRSRPAVTVAEDTN